MIDVRQRYFSHRETIMTDLEGDVSTIASVSREADDSGACVLLATNGSAEAEAALRFAAALAEREELTLRVLTVIETLPVLAHQGSAMARHTPDIEEAKRLLERARAEVSPPASRASVVTAMIVGRRGPTIAEAARKWNARFVVLGTGRRGAFERLLAGDTMGAVLRDAATPVIAVPVSCGSLARTGVAAVDFTDASLRAARAAAEVIGDGMLHLVHVRPEIEVPVVNAWPAIYTAGATTLLDRLSEAIHDEHPDVRTEIHLLRGHAPDVLQRFASEMGADLLALGQHHHPRLEEIFFGSVVRELAKHATTALLIAPATA